MRPPATALRVGAAMLLALVLAACTDPSAPPTDPPAQFITVRRAWAAGERAATIARIKANRSFSAPLVGDISDDADMIYADTDSVTVMIANPLYSAFAANELGLVMGPQFATNWDITGIDVRMVNTTVLPVADTLHWIGVFWSNPAESTWKGFALVAANTNPATTTVPATTVNTTAFDASGGKSGAGVGEQRATATTTWLGNGGAGVNTVQVTSAAWGGTSTVTTGPFLGGTAAAGTMQGRMRTIDMTRSSGAGAPATFQVDLDFRVTAINGIRYVCIYKNPCTTNTP